jgi:hypothetical protein
LGSACFDNFLVRNTKWINAGLLIVVGAGSKSKSVSISGTSGSRCAVAALYIARKNWRYNKRKTAVDVFLESLNGLKRQSQELIDRVQANLSGKFNGESPETHRDHNQKLFDDLKNEVGAASHHLQPKEADALSKELDSFWISISASRYPVFDEEHAVEPDSQFWKSANEA